MMIPDPAYIRQLFIKHAEGTATEAEAAFLIRYLQEGGSEEVLPGPEELIHITTAPKALDATATARVLDHILPAPATIRQAPRRIRYYGWAAMAAAVITTLVLVYRPSRPAPTLLTTTTSYGEIRQLTLPDGSQVTLNAGTTLQYDSIHWHTASKEVWIKGEAFFDVVPNHTAFTVHAGEAVAVQVLGTRFSVATQQQQVQVILNSGKVKVNISNHKQPAQSVVLQPGEMAAYHLQRGQLSLHQADTLQLTSWKDNQFTFRENSLEDIAEKLTAQFGVQITFDSPQLAQLRFTGTTPANNLDVILTILKSSLDIRIDQHNNQIMIKPAR
ncbi:FecR family protein [Chitinophaga nivalis]|uniref:FecR domain-containing protein n=1 Tax=Chitinophaga nivalis TaxID=2991709 RepID=A0ABT3II43_9BACT|nr:FecR domain-containing protein [Chitinophaga nivalis]MCW3466706.1 FecR domain-containing protein [Chitinophaga nivalis]MCW3483603.1 FecR domain-containing protein [Chitinophaga nivalis]